MDNLAELNEAIARKYYLKKKFEATSVYDVLIIGFQLNKEPPVSRQCIFTMISGKNKGKNRAMVTTVEDIEFVNPLAEFSLVNAKVSRDINKIKLISGQTELCLELGTEASGMSVQSVLEYVYIYPKVAKKTVISIPERGLEAGISITCRNMDNLEELNEAIARKYYLKKKFEATSVYDVLIIGFQLNKEPPVSRQCIFTMISGKNKGKNRAMVTTVEDIEFVNPLAEFSLVNAKVSRDINKIKLISGQTELCLELGTEASGTCVQSVLEYVYIYPTVAKVISIPKRGC